MRRSTALIAGAAAAAGWEAVRRSDRRRVAADPAHALLADPPRGDPFEVASADGSTIHAEAFGPDDAPTIVLVHGWTCALEFWVHQLATIPGRFRVVAYDQRGHGRSRAAGDRAYAIEDFASDFDAVLDACGPGPVVAAGHSLGAMTIVAWAGQNPGKVADRLAAAALLNTGIGGLITESMVVRTPQRLTRAKDLAGRVMLEAAAPIPRRVKPISSRAIAYVTLGPHAGPATADFVEKMVLECRRDVRAACGGTFTRLDLREAVASLDAPTLVVSGERDRLTPPVHGERLVGDLPSPIDHVVVPGSGHMGPLEEPALISGLLEGLAAERLGAGGAPVAA